MKKSFPEYYDSEIKKLWKQAIFVFDANVLLDVYRFSPQTSDTLLSILSHDDVKNRIWIPYHFAYEYHRNLSKIRDKVRKEYSDRSNELKRLCANITERLQEFSKRTGFPLDSSITEELNSFYQDTLKPRFESISNEFDGFQTAHETRLSGDSLEESIAKLFRSKVGNSFGEEELKQIYDLGKQRYDNRIPPGYRRRDRDKGEPQCYGDLVGWFQIIRYVQCAKAKRPVIMITDDSSGDDWFDKPHGKPLGPRPELVKEMREKAGVSFYLYKTRQFMNGAKQHLKIPISKSAIEEVDSLNVNLLFSWLHDHIDDDFGREYSHSLESLRRIRPGLKHHRAKLVGESFAREELEHPDFQEANLWRANFRRAVIWGASFRRANLQCVDFTEARITHTDMSAADLRGAYLAEAILHGTLLDDAILPDGLLYETDPDIARFTEPQHRKFRRTLKRVRAIRIELGCE